VKFNVIPKITTELVVVKFPLHIILYLLKQHITIILYTVHTVKSSPEHLKKIPNARHLQDSLENTELVLAMRDSIMKFFDNKIS